MSGDAAAVKAQMRAVFERSAPDYDAAGPGCFAHFGRRLTEVAGVAPGQRVLDVATGRGAALLPAAERVGPGGSAVGIDLSETMLDLARAEAARRHLTVELRAMDAEHLAFPDASFDRVLCAFGVMFFPDLARALGEVRRILAPGGVLAVSTWRVSQGEDLGAVLAQLGLMQVGGDPAIQFREPETLAGPLAAAGFTDVRITVERATFRYADVAEYWQNARGTGMRRWLDQLDTADRERALAALGERVQPHRREDGLYLEASALFATATR
jgi:SAM-dependent methyltransferase